MTNPNTTTELTKESMPFLVEAMERRRQPDIEVLSFVETGAATGIAANKAVTGAMNIPKPITVDTKSGMSNADYKACAMVMAVCQNMVQKTITNAAQKKGIPVTDALQNMEAWVTGYTAYPFPFFNFVDAQGQDYKNDTFDIKVDPDAVEEIVNIKNVVDLKSAVVSALKASQGNLISYSKTKKDFNYFGVITAYTDTAIEIRLIKFQMHMQDTDVKILCAGGAKTHLDSVYNTFRFAGDKDLMIKIQASMGDKMVDYFAEQLLKFLKSFYDQELAGFNDKIANILSARN